MSSIADISFEVFPPKTPASLAELAVVTDRLALRAPRFVSVTYGACGTDRQRSFDAISLIGAAGLDVAAHITCVGQSAVDIADVLDRFAALGVRQVVALRGDSLDGVDARYQPHPEGYAHTADLVADIVARGGFEVTVAAYPEKHPQSPSIGHDLDVLAGKVAAGATRAITQMCFDVEAVIRLRDRIEARKLDVELVPGIFPIHSFPTVARFAARCGASIPASVESRFSGVEVDGRATARLGAELAAEHMVRLSDEGISAFHLYTLNRAELAIDALDLARFQRLSRTRIA